MTCCPRLVATGEAFVVVRVCVSLTLPSPPPLIGPAFGNELDTFEVDLSFEWNIDLKVVVVARLMKVSVPVKAENLSIS